MSDAEAPTAIPAVALVDDALVPIDLALIDPDERAAIERVLVGDEAVAEISRLRMPIDPGDLASFVEAMTEPTLDADYLRSLMQVASAKLVDLLASRQLMRQIASAMRSAMGGTVEELGPGISAAEALNGFQLVFLDYNLDPAKEGGERALEIAEELAKVEGALDAPAGRRIVLMSSDDRVRSNRTAFRKTAGLAGTSFAFVAKADLDRPWKVRSHLQVLERSAPVSTALAGYLSSLKQSMRQAVDVLEGTIDDLDLGDFAYIQRLALRADGHPLGDYLTWLLSSHVTRIVFEGSLRDPQFAVDRVRWGAGPLSQTAPSTKIASLYHDSLFSARQGPLVSHPLADPGGRYDGIPMIQLGDVFFDKSRSKALVVMSAACDLAFAPDPNRPPDSSRAVLLVHGVPELVHASGEEGPWNTRGVLHDEKVYRIEWDFNSYGTKTLGEIQGYLEQEHFETADRERLRPLYALKLQQEFGAHLTRVGPPVMAPVARNMSARIAICGEASTEYRDLADGEIVASYHKAGTTIRLTTGVVGQLQMAAEQHLQDRRTLRSEADSEEAASSKAAEKKAKRLENLDRQIVSLTGQIENDDLWITLADDQLLPKVGTQSALRGPVRIQHGGSDLIDSKSGIVLLVNEVASPGVKAAERIDKAGADEREPQPVGHAVSDMESPVWVADHYGAPWRSSKK